LPKPQGRRSRVLLLLLLLLASVPLFLVVTDDDPERGADSRSPYLRGINVAGAEFDTGAEFDSDASFAFYAERGHELVRLPIRWEEIQRPPGAELDPEYLARLRQAVGSSTSRGMTTIIDVHNYHRYDGEIVDGSAVTRAHLADLWAKLAAEFAGDPLVEFGLMNEPHDVPGGARAVEEIAQSAVTAIRATGAENFIWVSGDDWSSAASFPDLHPTWWIDDPLDRSGAEGHYYFDESNQRRGTYPNSIEQDEEEARRQGHGSLAEKVQADLGRFVSYCERHDLRCLIGEIGWPNGTSASAFPAEASAWNAVAEAAYEVLDAGGLDVTYWAAGEAWGDGYNLSLYVGTPQSRATSVASVVEAHPSNHG
jgi:hypothetical protein